MDKLTELQTERRRNYEQDLKEEMDIAEASEINGLPYEAPKRRSQNGIVFSTAEIQAAANRRSVVKVARGTYGGPKRIFFEGAWEKYDDQSPNRPNSGLKIAAAA